MKLSLMTINMMFQFGYKYLIMDHDAEDYEESWLEMMDLVREAGFQAVDVTSIELMALGADKIHAELEKRGIAVSSVIDFDSYMDTEPGSFEQKLAIHKANMDAAVKLDTKVIMLALGTMGPGGAPAGDRKEAHEKLAAYFRPLSEYAKSLGLHPVVEDTPNLAFYLDKAADLKEILDTVPDLEVVYDSGNMLLVGEDPVEYYKLVADRTAHIHLKDMMYVDPSTRGGDMAEDGRKMNTAPAGTGIVDMPALLAEIKKSGYDGYLTVEYAKHPEMSWADSLKASREYYEALL